MSAIYGPPWQTVDDPKQLLQLDPPVLTACNALAAVAPRRGVLVRLDRRSDVERAALVLSRDTGDPVSIFRGAIQTRSGGWLWPFQVDVVDVHKAEGDDPTTRDGFIGTVEELLDDLMAMADEAEAVAFGAASEELSFDYVQATADEIEGAVGRAAALIAALPLGAAFATAATSALANITQRVAELSALAVPGLSLGLGLTADQTELARMIGSDAMVFVTDEFRRRSARLGVDARSIIANGVQQGLGRQDIGRNLNQALGHRLSGRDEWYFRVVASTAVSRSRSYGQMVGYRGAGIDFYMWYALMDERTCVRGDTLVTMVDGSELPVEDVFPGDIVTSCKGRPQRVLAKTIVPKRTWVRIGLSDGRWLNVTPEHPVLTKEGWTTAGRVIIGDDVVDGRKPDGLQALWEDVPRQAPAEVLLRGVSSGDAPVRGLREGVLGPQVAAAEGRPVLLQGVHGFGGGDDLLPVRRDFHLQAKPRKHQALLLDGVQGGEPLDDCDVRPLRRDVRRLESLRQSQAVLLQELLQAEHGGDHARAVRLMGARGLEGPVRAGGPDRQVDGGLPDRRLAGPGGRRRVLALVAQDQEAGRRPRQGARRPGLHGGQAGREGHQGELLVRGPRSEELWPRPADRLLDRGRFVGVTSVEWVQLDGPIPAYDLEVEEDHSMVAEGIVVHNCEICRFLHGQQFPVASPLQAFNRAFRNPDPEAAVNEFPWYRVVGGERDPSGLRVGGNIHVQPRQGPLGALVASTRESGVGQRDVAGTHRVHTNPQAAGGTLVPPAHGMCRCTTIPV